MAEKRRAIWMNDLDWMTLQAEAHSVSTTASGLIRDWVHDHMKAAPEPFTAFRPVPKPRPATRGQKKRP